MTRIERTVDLNAAIEQISAITHDVRGTAACLPGLTIGEPLDARTFKASMGVQAGLLVVRYTGTLWVGEVNARRGPVRFRVDGVAPGGLTLAVAIEIAVVPRTEGTSRLTIVNDITLDAGTTLLAGPMIAIVAGTLLDGFSRNLKRAFDPGRILPPNDGARMQS